MSEGGISWAELRVRRGYPGDKIQHNLLGRASTGLGKQWLSQESKLVAPHPKVVPAS